MDTTSDHNRQDLVITCDHVRQIEALAPGAAVMIHGVEWTRMDCIADRTPVDVTEDGRWKDCFVEHMARELTSQLASRLARASP